MSQNAIEAKLPFPWQTKCWERLLQQYQQETLPHAILISGPAGIGKHAMLKQLARTMLCLGDGKEACGHCHNCQLGHSGDHPDILQIEPAEGARDITIEQIRALGEFVHKTGHTGIAKIVLIRHAHRMNQSASNALLKTLEEPSAKTFLFLETELPGYLSATIRSRCQRIAMSMPELDQSARWLEQFLQENEDAGALLSATGCRPMLALELAQSGELQERQEFSSALRQLMSGKLLPENVVALGMKIGPIAAVDALSVFLSTLLSERLDKDREESFANIQGTRGLFQLYEDCLLSRKQLLGTANPNPQLLLESLLWHLSSAEQGGSLHNNR